MKSMLSSAIIALLLTAAASALEVPTTSAPCPCSNPEWCKPVSDVPANRKELFVFHPRGAEDQWKSFNWSHITTIAFYGGGLDMDLLCYAHSKKVRVVHATSFSTKILPNATKRTMFVKETMKFVANDYLDGVNMDFEEPVSPSQKSLQQDIISIMTELRQSMDSYFAQFGPNVTGQLSFDTEVDPYSTWRVYDYAAMSPLVDFFMIMDYDTFGCPGGVHPHGRYTCAAGANSPLRALDGLPGWLNIVGNNTNKLVVGLPWYGHIYQCVQGGYNTSPVNVSNTTEKCIVTELWKAPNTEYGFATLMAILRGKLAPGRIATTNLTTNLEESSAHFNFWFEEHQSVFQAWFDTPETLLQKYNYVKSFNLRGLSMWNADELAYGDNMSPDERSDNAAMWTAIGSYFN